MTTTGSSLKSCHGSEALTHGFRVTVTPTYMPEESGESPTEAWRGKRYVFAYRIRITNEGERRAQLLDRHWVIVDADGERHEVHGEGVVGHQPTLAPGQAFEYSSYCPLATPWGTMEGEFIMQGDDGERFEIDIGRFYLVAE
jgi:ApaG protein